MEREIEDNQEVEQAGQLKANGRVYLCDQCGFEMVETNCKVMCRNCGARWDCSDLTIYMDWNPPGECL